MKISITTKLLKSIDLVILANKKSKFEDFELSEEEIKFIERKIKDEEKTIKLNKLDNEIFIQIVDEEKAAYKEAESVRKSATGICKSLNKNKKKNVLVVNNNIKPIYTVAFVESLLLSNYTFNKYFTKDVEKKQNTLDSIQVLDKNLSNKDLDKIKIIIDGVYIARDLVNEPFSGLNSVDLANKIKEISNESGFNLEVLNKKQIEALKMGGILAVNRASEIPPTFSILEWKPEKRKNSKPIILVGKGIVFDSGGYSLKPGQYMEDMKSDMAGAAAVIGVLSVVAKLKLPVHVIGLVPSTDNLIGKNGYVPGDVLKMYNGMTVEVLNTDAEGRLILADALSYAKKYNPELVIDLATLTGAAARAIGDLASGMMSNASRKVTKALHKSGKKTYERLMEFPLWEEYSEMLKSPIADLKNIGGINAGHITAAKFLENFTDYPWVHLDIAPNAYLEKNNDYRGKGATGIPVRMLVHFIENYII
ncbi:MAG: leucyl aminopeptidase [Bacteroidales bacterium]|nr:leucyl aminopeptidase [Bacteroidales bacterium]